MSGAAKGNLVAFTSRAPGVEIVNIDAAGTGINGGSWGRAKVFFKPGYGEHLTQQGQEMLPAVEWIASRLALAVGLPTPTGQIGQLRDGRQVWVSMVVQLRSEDTAPPDPADVVRSEPSLAAGALVFDSWIYNNDRHDENVLFHKDLGLWLIDHDQALSGPSVTDTRATLPTFNHSALSKHVFRNLVADGYVQAWITRIRSLPLSVVKGIIETGYRAGIYTKDYGRGISDFLEIRRTNLPELVSRLRGPSEISAPATPGDQAPIDFNGGAEA